MVATGGGLSHLDVYFLLSYRIFTNLRSTKKRCISATSTSSVTCTYRLKTTQVRGRGPAVPSPEDRQDRNAQQAGERSELVLARS